jgi:uncharacterized protein (DUF1778 family)
MFTIDFEYFWAIVILLVLTRLTKTKNMKADDRLAVRIPKPEKEALRNKAKLEGKSPSEVLLDLIRSYLKQETVRSDESIKRLNKLEEEVAKLKQGYLGES